MASNEQILNALDTLRQGVYIVTTSYRKKAAGCTCVWVSRVSFDPPLMGVSLAPGRHTLQVIEAGKRFCINVLGESGVKLGRRFGFASEPGEDRFEGVGFKQGKSGSPVLDIAVSYIDCQLHSIVPVGDHRLVLGKIVDAAVCSPERPVLYDPDAYYSSILERGAASSA